MQDMKWYVKVLLVISTIVLAVTGSAHALNPPIYLPSTYVSMEVTNLNDLYCFYRLKLSDVPTGYNISNGSYLGWCGDEYADIPRTGVVYTVRMYSSCDPANPRQNAAWDKINYILNHKKGDKCEIQAAIWSFFAEGDQPSSPDGQAMVNEANAKGDGFVPTYGQVVGVILIPTVSVQIAIIEVPVPPPFVIPEYPLGPISGIAVSMVAFSVFRLRNTRAKHANARKRKE